MTLTTSLDAFRRSVDPFDDPKNDVHNPLRYIPSAALAGIGLVLYLFLALAHTWNLWKFRGKYMIAMVIGCYFYAIGLGLRFSLRSNPDSISTFIPMNLFVTLSPCGFIASEYMILGRLASWLNCANYLFIPANRVTVIFVTSDVLTFLIQGSGGGLAASSSSNSVQLGSHIFLAGLIIQLISFSLFTALFLRFLWMVMTQERHTWTKDGRGHWQEDWRCLAGAMAISCVGILVRSFYRVVEMAGGFTGTLTTTESYFYALDALPLFCAVAIYVPAWPGRYVPDGVNLRAVPLDEEHSGKAQSSTVLLTHLNR